ncbi:hypothetical protein [Methylobacter sp.]|uniref:hypothetical protein n=1 Tax=Methylobacter sp. TaxID=2051955 RepID=UPI00262E1FCB|nr:hypothetical protein [Methylobacter sp.]
MGILLIKTVPLNCPCRSAFIMMPPLIKTGVDLGAKTGVDLGVLLNVVILGTDTLGKLKRPTKEASKKRE